MTARLVSFAVAFAAAMAMSPAPAAPAAPAADAGPSHAGHAATPAKLTLDHGRKWGTDAPLRAAMNEIRTLVAPKVDAIHRGKLTADEYQALGVAIEKQVADIVAQCKLPPEADAMLHLIVADLVAGTDMMQGKAKGGPAGGAHKVVVAANNYGRYFDHPGWKPIG